jgi:hypothetical protein
MCLCFPQKFPAYEIIGLIGSSRSDKDAGVYDALHRRISERISTALFSPFQAQLTFRASSSIRASQSIAGFGTIFPGLSDTSRAAGPPSGPVNVMDSPKDNPLSSFSKLHAALFMGMASDIILFLYPLFTPSLLILLTITSLNTPLHPLTSIAKTFAYLQGCHGVL